MVRLPRVREEVPHRFFCLLSWSILIMMRTATRAPMMGMAMRT